MHKSYTELKAELFRLYHALEDLQARVCDFEDEYTDFVISQPINATYNDDLDKIQDANNRLYESLALLERTNLL